MFGKCIHQFLVFRKISRLNVLDYAVSIVKIPCADAFNSCSHLNLGVQKLVGVEEMTNVEEGWQLSVFLYAVYQALPVLELVDHGNQVIRKLNVRSLERLGSPSQGDLICLNFLPKELNFNWNGQLPFNMHEEVFNGRLHSVDQLHVCFHLFLDHIDHRFAVVVAKQIQTLQLENF